MHTWGLAVSMLCRKPRWRRALLLLLLLGNVTTLAQGDIWPGSSANCQAQLQGSLPVFYDFQNSNISAHGPLPSQGFCATWSMPLDLTNPRCNASNSNLLIEMWLTDGKQTLDRRQNVDGLYLLANVGQPLSVQVLGNGDISIDSSLSLYSPVSPLQGSYIIDSQAMINHLAFRRILVPVGTLLQQPGVALWSLTLVGAAPFPSSYGFDLRATCMPLSELPCPRPAAALGSCNTTFTSPPAPAGQCSADTLSCTCPPGSMDPACGTPVTNLSAADTSTWLQIPGRSWSYFLATGQASTTTRLLAELTKPPNSAETYLPALVVSSRGWPGFTDIDAAASNLQSSCGTGGACSTCTCDVPAQAQDRLYASRVQQAGAAPPTWYIGVFNALPPGTTISNSMKLRVRLSSDAVQPPPLCPADCSGAGSCLPVDSTANSPDAPAPYSCACQPGMTGPYCQGPSQTIQLSGFGFDSGKVTLQPGQWQFYFISSSPSSQGAVTWLPGGPGLLMVFSPMYGNGSLFFSANETAVYNATCTFQLPQSSKPYGWSIGVLNSDAVSTSLSSFRLVITQQSGSPTISFTSLLQMALIGSVSGFAILFLCFMLIKVVMMRRSHQQSMAGMLAASELHVMQQPGVPAPVVASFPLFKFGASSKEALIPKALLQGSQAAPVQPPPASEAAAALQAPAAAAPAHAAGAPAGSASMGACAGWQRVEPPSRGQGQPMLVGCIQQLERSATQGDELQCSVCIQDFEIGEMLRQLPCRHVFHQSCIDPWMRQHTTCPNCRWVLCPREGLDAGAATDVEAGSSRTRQALPSSAGRAAATPSLDVAPTDEAVAVAVSLGDGPSAHMSARSLFQPEAASRSQPGTAAARDSSMELSRQSVVVQVVPRDSAVGATGADASRA